MVILSFDKKTKRSTGSGKTLCVCIILLKQRNGVFFIYIFNLCGLFFELCKGKKWPFMSISMNRDNFEMEYFREKKRWLSMMCRCTRTLID